MAYTVAQFETDLREPFAWPGGYPRFFITSDCAALSYAAARSEADSIKESMGTGSNDGWRVVACEVNWEDAELVCDHTGKSIPSAYGADNEGSN